MQPLKIVALNTLAAIVYGILHDQITARICVEYFTVAHAPLFVTDSVTLLALFWGVIATWWLGLFSGVLLAIAARVGPLPKLTAMQLVKPIGALMLASATLALCAGVTAYVLATQGGIELSSTWQGVIPPHKHAAFLADAWAHNTSYLVGSLGSLILIAHTISRRIRADAHKDRAI
ncbi:MAG TPA: hypothetical protein VF719_07625 [Abditibacteriaceae bacterium]|jgi:hypothetical protein